MESKIAGAISLKYQPVALIWSDEKLAEAVQFQEGKWGCIMWLAASAAKGKAAVCNRKQLGDNLMTFTVPLAMFEEMERNVAGSFLERHTWQTLLKAKNGE